MMRLWAKALCVVLLFLPSFVVSQWHQSPSDTADVNVFAAYDTMVFAGTTSGLLVSFDRGQTWQVSDSDLTNLDINALAFDDTVLIAGTDQGVFFSTDYGFTWASFSSAKLSTEVVEALIVTPNGLYAGTREKGVYRWNCSDSCWTKPDTTWTASDSGLTDEFVISLVKSGPNLIAGTYGKGIFLSTDNGSGWKRVTTLDTSLYIYSLYYDTAAVLAGTDKGAFRSTDNGLHWTAIDSGLTNHSVTGFAGDRIALFGATELGVFTSTDNGSHWHAVAGEPANQEVISVLFADSILFAGVGLDGLWMDSVYVVEGVRTRPLAVPAAFVLEQNYPNPFNPTTVIPFQLRKYGFVSLVIYDQLGRKIETLVAKDLPAGEYRTHWDANVLPSGVYYYQLIGKDFTQTKRMMVIK